MKTNFSGFKFLFLISLFLNIVLLYKYIKRKIDDYQSITYFENRQSIYELLPINRKDIVFVGDSHTQRFDYAEFYNTTQIKNRGIAGDNTAGVLNRLRSITNGHPAKLFLQIGINDFIENLNTTTALENYKCILKSIKYDSPDSKIYTESILPTKLVNQDTIIKYNNGIKKLSAEYGATYINMYNIFNDRNLLNKIYDSGDGLHLNGNGYMKLKDILAKYIFE